MKSLAEVARAYERVRPYQEQKVQAALASHLGDVDAAMDSLDVFEKVSRWPRHYQRLFHRPHLDNKERFALFLFFVFNGMDFFLARTILLGMRSQRLDRSGEDQMNFLCQRASNGELFQRYTAPILGVMRE